MSRYMDNNAEAANSMANAAKMNVENPYQYNYISSPLVDAGDIRSVGGTPPFGSSNGSSSELTYTDDNSTAETAMGNQASSTAKNTNTIVHLTPADASPNDAKQFVVDDFLTHTYLPPDITNNIRPNAQGLYGKGAK